MINVVTLSNGIKIAYEHIAFVRSVSFGIWIKNGSFNEDVENNGISHFIEHMLFKGTEKRTAKNIADEMDCIGGHLNAFTSKEYTCYYTTTLDTHFETALDVLSDMFFNSKFAQDDINKELNVILEEIDMYEDSPEELVFDLMQEGIWPNSSIRLPILGSKESIKTFDTNILKTYLKNMYTPDNIVISIAGNFEEKTIVETINKYFGSMESIEKPIDKKRIEPIVYKPCFMLKEKDIEQVHLVLGLPSIKMGTKDAYTLAIINTLFGSGISSRLFQQLREEHGLAYSVYSHNSSYLNTGLYNIYMGLNKANIEKSLDLIQKEIELICKDGITDIELKNTKEQIKSNYILGLESSYSRMNNIGRSLLMLGKVTTPNQLIEKIEAVTTQDALRIANDIFKKENLSLCMVGNVKNCNQENITKYLSSSISYKGV
jgi:predicted Zn-dependent peptidase